MFMSTLLSRMECFMKKILLMSLAAFAFTAQAAERYKDRMFSVDVQKDVVYSKDTKFMDESSNHELMNTLGSVGTMLGIEIPTIHFFKDENAQTDTKMLMDVYTPQKDNEKDRAVVLVVHGGAFLSGAKDDYEQISIQYCDSLAARGYVTASVSYRLGTLLNVIEGVKDTLRVDSAAFARTVYRGVQDVGAAVRYFRKNADKLGVDPNKIFVMGNSSGGILALENLYAKSKKDFPSYMNDSKAYLGELDEFGEQGVSSTANAVVSLWGAVHDKKLVENSNSPVLLVHGKGDPTVPFKADHPLKDPKALLMNQIPKEYSSMASLFMNAYVFDFQSPMMYGSFVVDSILKKRNVEHETYFVEEAVHEVYDVSEYTDIVQSKVFDFLYKQAISTVNTTILPASRAFAKANDILMGADNRNFTYIGQKDGAYEICDLRGRTLLSGQISAGDVVDMSALRNGVYVLSVHGTRVMRFAISK